MTRRLRLVLCPVSTALLVESVNDEIGARLLTWRPGGGEGLIGSKSVIRLPSTTTIGRGNRLAGTTSGSGKGVSGQPPHTSTSHTRYTPTLPPTSIVRSTKSRQTYPKSDLPRTPLPPYFLSLAFSSVFTVDQPPTTTKESKWVLVQGQCSSQRRHTGNDDG